MYKELADTLDTIPLQMGHGPGIKLTWVQTAAIAEAIRVIRHLSDGPATASASDGVGTAPASVAATSHGTEWQAPAASQQSAVSDTPKAETSASASDTTGKVPVASDKPINNMPSSARERAEIRMGTRKGPGRP